MKIIIFRGDVTDISAKKEALIADYVAVLAETLCRSPAIINTYHQANTFIRSKHRIENRASLKKTSLIADNQAVPHPRPGRL